MKDVNIAFRLVRSYMTEGRLRNRRKPSVSCAFPTSEKINISDMNRP